MPTSFGTRIPGNVRVRGTYYRAIKYRSATRLPTDELDQVVLRALQHVYENDGLIDRVPATSTLALARARPQRAEELAAVDGQLHNTGQALDRYLQASESGSVWEAVCGPPAQPLVVKA